jgi:TPP-dependent indolepyruvate ferredoxin oxidoreductase alpha subunit
MNIYSPSPENFELFESLKTISLDNVILEPLLTKYTKEMHPLYGTKMPEKSRLQMISKLKGRRLYDVHPQLNKTWDEMYGKDKADEMRNALSKRSTDRVVAESTKEKIRKLKTGKKRPNLFSEESINKMKKARAGSGNPRAIKVIINGVEYGSKKEACEALGIKPSHLHKFLT